MPSLADCEREIVQLHDCFVRWYCGEGDEATFERVERSLGPAFERVSPDGTVHDREAVLAGIRSARDAHDAFDIEIRNVEPVAVDDERALVRYEEWQSSADGENGRLSTALFEPGGGRASTHGEPPVRWTYLQETWLDAPDR